MRVLWCVTGGEYMMGEACEAFETLEKPTVAFSSAGEEVARMYGLFDRFAKKAEETIFERSQGKSSQATMRLSKFDAVVVAPCSANTAAKLACGISDSLVTNLVSQALKNGIKVVILPTDAKKEVIGKTVSGKEIRIKCRPVDLANVKRLKKEVKVAYSKDSLIDSLLR